MRTSRLTTSNIRPRLKHSDYTVGWICAHAQTDLAAAGAMLDEEHQILPAADPSDGNVYLLGRIGGHNVVITCLPGGAIGKVSAATVATDMVRSFQSIRFGLVVGTGGGAPYYGRGGNWGSENREGEGYDSDSDEEEDIRDIRLGDVVVSLQSKYKDAVVQYDFGKSIQCKEFVLAGGRLNNPPAILLSAISMVKADHIRKGNRISETLAKVFSDYPNMAEACLYPGHQRDRLFKSEVVHPDDKRSCEACCGYANTNLVRRKDRLSLAPRIHYGTIGSADQVMKDAILRDKWSEKENIICFEMEAAGLMDSFPCIVIKGISNYADTHNNDIWKPYAAATAATYAKELLSVIPGQCMFDPSPIEESDRSVSGMKMLMPSRSSDEENFYRSTNGSTNGVRDLSSYFDGVHV